MNEKKTKPQWAAALPVARQALRDAQDGLQAVLKSRCMEWVRVPGGATNRCTADGQPEHEHRWDKEELP